MVNSSLTLRGSLSQLQRHIARYYSNLQQRFEGNTLVSGMWATMGHDLQAQVENLKKMPASFWSSLKDQEGQLAQAAHVTLPTVEGPLRSCLEQTLALEEPVILKVYAPLIHRLRSDWTEMALDFYVLIKAHISRLAQSIQMFSGDPALSLRCVVLLQNFEKEVQGQVKIAPVKEKPQRRKARTKPTRVKIQAARTKRAVRAIDKISKRAKPLVQKIEIPRRRAQR